MTPVPESAPYASETPSNWKRYGLKVSAMVTRSLKFCKLFFVGKRIRFFDYDCRQMRDTFLSELGNILSIRVWLERN